jgi:hypothetical protein
MVKRLSKTGRYRYEKFEQGEDAMMRANEYLNKLVKVLDAEKVKNKDVRIAAENFIEALYDAGWSCGEEIGIYRKHRFSRLGASSRR